MKCKHCKKDKETATGCTKTQFYYEDGKVLNPIPFGMDQYAEAGERCSGCNCKIGHFHHVGCQIERCPRCEGLALTCHCKLIDEDRIMAELMERKR